MSGERFRCPQWLKDMEDPAVLPRALGLSTIADGGPVKTEDAPVTGYTNRELRSNTPGSRPRLTLPVKSKTGDEKDAD